MQPDASTCLPEGMAGEWWSTSFRTDTLTERQEELMAAVECTSPV